MNLFVRIFIQVVAVLLAAWILPGVSIDSFFVALVVAIVLGIVNAFIKPILLILTLPITILTFGLFLLVINALLVLLVELFIPGFVVDGFWWALLFSIIVSVVGSSLENFS